MSDVHGEDIEVLPCEEGWAVTSGGLRLKHFAGEDQFQALGRACQWSSKYAEARGVHAWFLQGGRRTPITLANSSALWKPKG